MVGTMALDAGVPAARLVEVLDILWEAHVQRNLWSLVPDGLIDALGEVRRAGVRTVVVSNSEGMLEPLFEQLGFAGAIDAVVDSGKVGIEKPDPRIFQLALAPFGVAPERALHLGDSYATDVVGAREAGVRVALVDPFGHWEGAYPEVLRVPSAAACARVLTELRSMKST
jgi:putative hydrolase of the HAD superfamily